MTHPGPADSTGGARAARVTGPGVIEVGRLELSTTPGPGEVEIEVLACGICGSNLHHLRNPDAFTLDRRHTPGALGHEAAGRVVSVGPGVSPRGVGDLVALEPQLAAACGRCAACERGVSWFCSEPSPLPIWGFADRIVVRESGAWPLPPDLDPGVASLVEAMGCSVHAIRSTALCAATGDDLSGVRVGVIGAGATGLLAVAAARALGAAEVACLARHHHQAGLAERLGATHVVRDDEKAEAHLAEFAADLVVECVGGSAGTIDLALRAVRPGGEVSVLGLFDTPQPFDARFATRRELRLVFPVVYGVVRGRHDFEIAARILRADQPAFRELVTHRFPLSLVAAAFEQAGAKGEGVVRVLVVRD